MKKPLIDIAIIGGGAAGLMAAIYASSQQPTANIVIFDGAKKLGAKILVAGGGRCNVTHEKISPKDYAGSTSNAIKKILGRFDEKKIVDFFEQRGVPLKTEGTGKLFPTSDKASDVLNALINSCLNNKVSIETQHRISKISKNDFFEIITTKDTRYHAQRVIVATGGKSLPKTGSDGFGYTLVEKFGHQLTPLILPALVPLCLEDNPCINENSGISFKATLTLQQSDGKPIISFTNNLLCTHFGISGPLALDISRYYLEAIAKQDSVELRLNFLPDLTQDQLLNMLLKPAEKRNLGTLLQQFLPNKLVYSLMALCDIPAHTKCQGLSKQKRNLLLQKLYQMALTVTTSRGFKYAEVTAGGVPLSQLELSTLESRHQSGLYLCGEILDVDGRIGGFNFQWAWASGYTAGVAAANSLAKTEISRLSDPID